MIMNNKVRKINPVVAASWNQLGSVKTPKPWYKRKRGYVILLLVGSLIWAYSVLELRVSDGVMQASLGENALGINAEVHYFNDGNHKLRYVEIGKDSLPLVVFIHGAPSSSNFWNRFMKDSRLLNKAKMLAVDRPGYGFSNFGNADTSVESQAALIADLIRQVRHKHQRIIVYGSSYGGTVAARIAMDYPELVDGLVLQSASVEPGREKTFWISYPTTHWALRWLVPPAFDVANAEKLSHHLQLEKMRTGWRRILAPTIILHGTADDLIYPSNAYYACDQLVNSKAVEMIMVKGKAHDLLWTAPELLVKSLLKMLN